MTNPDLSERTRCEGCGAVTRLESGYCRACWGGRLTNSCTCHVSEPDEFGNRDLIEAPDCPLHG